VSAPAFVLLPGLDGTGELFEPFARVHGGQIVRYPRQEVLDRRQLAARVAAELPDSPYVLIAESYSGLVAPLLARRAPGGLVALVLCNTFVQPPVWPGLRHLPLALLMRWRPPTRVVRRLLLGDDAPHHEVRRALEVVGSVAPGVLAARVREILRTDTADELAACQVPLLYLRGRQDRLVPDSAVERVRRARPDLAYRELDGPHLLLQRRAAAAATVIGSFLDGLVPGRRGAV
jgi:pimeloyl-ACP methyl ester carboxylesterase